MNNKEAEKTPIVVSKSFLAVGPTLHYSHKNVQRCWLGAVIVFGLSCLFWSKITTGSFWTFEIETITSSDFWRLDKSTATGVSIFEYPWQIAVLGLLMGIIAVTPVLISQLMSFEHSLLLILEVVLFANLPGFAICLLISSFAAACRPLRFRSRFIAIALCTTPQMLFWIFLGGARGVEPVEWGFSFLPWICAWLEGLIIAGFVLGIGHFTRYRPGLVWIMTTITLILAVVVFEIAIGFDELDYQLYVAKNNPEYVNELHDHSIAEALNNSMQDPAFKTYLQGFFYPTEQAALRAELLREIQFQLTYDRWPNWFIVPDYLSYQTKRDYLLQQYELFVSKRLNSKRMPIALYFQALLSEYSPDIAAIADQEILHFYNDYPHEGPAEIWFELYRDFGYSPESIEARYRIARHWAGRRALFEQADELLAEAQTMASDWLQHLNNTNIQNTTDSLFSLFQTPADTVMTIPKINELQRKIEQLRTLISKENRNEQPDSKDRLAQFVLLNSHSLNYSRQLDTLLLQTQDNDPLRDNIMLLRTKLIKDENLQADALYELHQQFKNTDGAIQALYELGLLRISIWRQLDEKETETKKTLLEQARITLTNFINLYPQSFYAEQVKKNLDGLPSD